MRTKGTAAAAPGFTSPVPKRLSFGVIKAPRIDQTVLAIDSSFLGHQARLTIPEELTCDGEPVNVIFGFLARLLTLCERFETQQVVFCWDSKHSYRKDIFPDYKKSRSKMTAEEKEERRRMWAQMVVLRKEILPAIGFNRHRLQWGYEADDHMAVIAYSSHFRRNIIISADKDLYQLIRQGNRTTIYNPTSDKGLGLKKLKKKYGLNCGSDWFHMKALAGCPGDGVPGVRGVGEDSALKFLRGEKVQPNILAKIEACPKFFWGPADPLTLQLTWLPFRPLAGRPEYVPPDYAELKLYKFRETAVSVEGIKQVIKRYQFESMKPDIERWEKVARFK